MIYPLKISLRNCSLTVKFLFVLRGLNKGMRHIPKFVLTSLTSLSRWWLVVVVRSAILFTTWGYLASLHTWSRPGRAKFLSWWRSGGADGGLLHWSSYGQAILLSMGCKYPWSGTGVNPLPGAQNPLAPNHQAAIHVMVISPFQWCIARHCLGEIVRSEITPDFISHLLLSIYIILPYRHGKSDKVSASSVFNSEIFRQYIAWFASFFGAISSGGSISFCLFGSLNKNYHDNSQEWWCFGQMVGIFIL